MLHLQCLKDLAELHLAKSCATREGVAKLQLEYNECVLPKVTASIGVATTPPENRTRDISLIAESRKRDAKEAGKNRVVAT